VTLSREQVRHVANLARLGLEPGEEEFYAEQLSGILAHIERLGELDTEDIPPTAQVVAVEHPLRADEPREPLSQERALANAPRAEDGFFVVGAIVAEEEAGG
jgi:aspartyl-tRNA(Asn)/glutamyl-tRNA(Gln) amidotransferase subunit C